MRKRGEEKESESEVDGLVDDGAFLAVELRCSSVFSFQRPFKSYCSLATLFVEHKTTIIVTGVQGILTWS